MNQRQYTKETIQQVWEKGHVIEGLDKDLFRKDHCGAIIKRDLYMKSTGDSSMGWAIDRIKPQEHSGSSLLCNLQPLQWNNKKSKADHYPGWSCVVTSAGPGNVRLTVE